MSDKNKQTKLSFINDIKTSAYYGPIWRRLKPMEVSFIIDTITEWEDLPYDQCYMKSNRLFLDNKDEVMNGTVYKNAIMHPKKPDGKKMAKNNLEAIIEIIQVICSKQKG